MRTRALDHQYMKAHHSSQSHKNKLKKKNVAAILAFFLGMFGIHRFYVGQTGLGILYAIFSIPAMPIMTIIGIIDSIVIFAMDEDKFNFKYNRDYFKLMRQEQRDHGIYQQNHVQPVERYHREQYAKKEKAKLASKEKTILKDYRAKGIAQLQEYDLKAAIENFKKALAIAPQDTDLHFNIACAYSLSENLSEALYHLDAATANGFKDIQRIQNHDALAYVRIQDAYQNFAEHGFRLSAHVHSSSQQASEKTIDTPKNNLLEELKKLGDLRERGVLTDEEFRQQKQRIFER